MTRDETTEIIPAETASHPALLFLHYRVEQTLGIRAAADALVKLNEYLEKTCGASFVENPAAYEQMLASRERIFEIAKLLTVNETYFFREGAHFNLLLHYFLPQMSAMNRPIRICSAATSIGCEAYSIAMLLDYYVKSGHHLEYEIDAFDVSAEVIETAKNARYTANTLRGDSTEWKYIYDSRLIPDSGEYIVARDIREKVRFFVHNVLRGLERQYDIIFFRNALIYFSNKNRLVVMDDLASSLFSGGLLFLGVSETSSVRHPLLINRYMSDAFYFQKITPGQYSEREMLPEDYQKIVKPQAEVSAAPERPRARHPAQAEKQSREREPRPEPQKNAELRIDCAEVALILEKEEGAENTKKALDILGDGKNADTLTGSELAAAVASFLNRGDFNSASLALARLEKNSNGAVTNFLRGEYNFLCGNAGEAEKNYEAAAGKDRAFWPAQYRICSLAAEGNRTRYEYRIKKALEGLERGGNLHYECFLGGFSPDYFRRILERKLTENR
ncbi:hypothetical protein AGMMS49928_06500 [Spirochaetia bacterium]|nr:hypothetical protein AGMMS49928_06500 [Spirochaetia bacterium]